MTRELRGAFGIGAMLLALAAGRAEAAAVTIDLWAKPGTLTLPGAPAPVPVWGYSAAAADPAAVPGPVLVVAEGDVVTVNLHNLLTEPTALLFKGIDMVPDLSGAAASDGVTETVKSLTFTAAAPGAFLYEAGLLPNAQHQVAMGLYGALVVRPAASATQAYADPATAFDDEAVLVLSEIDPALNASPASFDMRNYAPKYWLINGKAYPGTAAITSGAGRRVLLRYLNAGSWHHSMALLGMRQTLMGLDGSPLALSRSVVAETLGPGQTLDAMATVPATAAVGSQFALYDAALLLHNNRAPGLGGMLTFVSAAAGAPGGGAAPTTTGVAVAPSPTNGSVDVSLTASIAAWGGASVTAAEYFVDSPGAGGSGTAMSGTFGGATAAVSATIAVAQLAALSSGSHAFYVHGQDSNGAWGPLNSATLVLDKAGPLVSALQLSPDPSSGSAAVSLRGTADDQASGGATIAAAEYAIDGGVPLAMSVTSAGAVTSEITATISAATLTALAEGSHAVAVRARDSLGNWGALASVALSLDRTGPSVAGVVSSPAATNGLQGMNSSTPAVRVSATGTDAASALAAAEGFIDTVGAPGTGFPFAASDGAWNGLSESFYADIPLSTVTLLSTGNHTLLVRARDAAGNWGATGSTTLLVDKTAPSVSAVTATPNPTNGALTFVLSADATDPAPTLGIVGGEWFEGADPGTGRGNPMTGTGPISATVDVVARNMAAGNHTLFVRAKDAAGNWSATGSVVVAIVLPEAIFADGFESGSFSAWNGGATGARISVTGPAALVGAFGMQAALGGGTAPGYVTDLTPAQDASYHARFYFDPSGSLPGGNANNVTLLAGLNQAGGTIFLVQYRRNNAGTYQVRGGALTATGTTFTNYFAVSNAAHFIEIAWRAASAGAPRFQLYTDGTLRQSLNVNTSASRLESVRFGPSAGLIGTASGTIRLDAFASTRTTVIGP